MGSANAPSEQQNEELKTLNKNFELRRILNNAYAFVRGEQTTQSFSAITYEDLADQQIESIEGKGTESRPTELERVNKIENELLKIVEEVKAADPNDFLLKDSRQDVNTEPELETA